VIYRGRRHNDASESRVDCIHQDRSLVQDQFPCKRNYDPFEVVAQCMGNISEPADQLPLIANRESTYGLDTSQAAIKFDMRTASSLSDPLLDADAFGETIDSSSGSAAS
jgi:hypothetical protein